MLLEETLIREHIGLCSYVRVDKKKIQKICEKTIKDTKREREEMDKETLEWFIKKYNRHNKIFFWRKNINLTNCEKYLKKYLESYHVPIRFYPSITFGFQLEAARKILGLCKHSLDKYITISAYDLDKIKC